MRVTGRSPEPFDRATRLADTMRDAAVASTHYREGDRIIVCILDTGEDGAIGAFGYGPADAYRILRDLLRHLAAYGNAIGVEVGHMTHTNPEQN